MTTKKLPDGRIWIEFNLTETEYQEALDAMCKLGAPDLASLIHYSAMRHIAIKRGEPIPPMPWREKRQTLLPITSAPAMPLAMPYSPAGYHEQAGNATRSRLRQMVAMKRQIELELINFAEAELMKGGV